MIEKVLVPRLLRVPVINPVFVLRVRPDGRFEALKPVGLFRAVIW
jgi:hypothetical protein